MSDEIRPGEWLIPPEARDGVRAANAAKASAPREIPAAEDRPPGDLAELLFAPGPLLLIDTPAMRDALEAAVRDRGVVRVGTGSPTSLHLLVREACAGHLGPLVIDCASNPEFVETILDRDDLSQVRIALVAPPRHAVRSDLVAGCRLARVVPEPIPIPGPGRR